MARPRKDKFKEIRIESTQEELEVVDVSVPSFVKVTYKVKVSEYNNGKPIYGTTDQIFRSLHQTNDEITKLLQEKGMEVIKIENATIPLPNICDVCGEKLIPAKINEFYGDWRRCIPPPEKLEVGCVFESRLFVSVDFVKGEKIPYYDENYEVTYKNTKKEKLELKKLVRPDLYDKKTINQELLCFMKA